MNDFDVAQLAPQVELLNHLALLELGLVVEPEVAYPAFSTASCAEAPWKTAWRLLWRVADAGRVVWKPSPAISAWNSLFR